MKGRSRRRPTFAREGARRRQAPPDLEGDKRSGVREEREHKESRTAAAAIRSRRGSCSLKPGLGGLIGMTSALGRIQSGPNVSDTRIQHKTYLHFQDTSGNISEAYPYPKRVGYGYGYAAY